VDRLQAAGAADAEPWRHRALGQQRRAFAAIADIQARVLAPPDATRRQHARQRSVLEPPLHFYACAPLTAPRKRHGDTRALAEHVDETHTRAIGEAVAVLEAQDR
jgi:hypothetical protein